MTMQSGTEQAYEESDSYAEATCLLCGETLGYFSKSTISLPRSILNNIQLFCSASCYVDYYEERGELDT